MHVPPARLFDPAWSTAVPDWSERILAGRPLVPDLPLHDAVAEKALRIFKRLRMPDVFGTPTHGEACGEWVFDLVRAVFGSFDPVARRRMIREFFLLVPKKNGKSSIAAAIIVTAAILNERPQAELLLIAPTKEIATIAFKQAAGIIMLDPELTKLFAKPQWHIKTLTHRLSGAQILVKSADTDVITGSKATYILIDETHVFASKPKAADVFLEVRGSLAARPDGFLLQITTQSKAPPSGVFKAELTEARDVRDGRIQKPLLAVLYELPIETSRDGGWKDGATWGLVNPNLNRSVDEAYLADELAKAERTGPEALALLASQHFNVQIGMALLHDRWVGADFWPAAAEPGLNLAAIRERCDVAVVGIDGGGMDDLLGLVVLGRETGSRRWLAWCRAWVHEIALKRRKEIAPKLEDLEAAGDLVICRAGDETRDIREIAELCAELNAEGLLPAKAAIGLDPEGVAAIVDALEEGGLDPAQIVPVSQGYKLNGAIKGTERKLFNGSLGHCGQELMTWCVANAKTEPRGNAVIVTKAISGSGKIDPLMALFNGVHLMSLNPEARGSIDDFLADPVMAMA